MSVATQATKPAASSNVVGLPDMKVSIRQQFGIDSDMEVPAYSEPDEHVPEVDQDYRFDKLTTLAILAGFAHNRRVMVIANGQLEAFDTIAQLRQGNAYYRHASALAAGSSDIHSF